MSKLASTSIRVTVDTLPVSPAYGQLLKCFHCHGEYSACRSDYFLLPSDHIFTCCRLPLRLVTKQTVYQEAA